MLLGRFLNFIQYEKNYSPNTLTSYKKDIKNFISFLETESFTVLEATHHQVRSYLASLMANGMQPRSINKIISTLRSFYKFLLREKLIDTNPLLLIKNLKTPKKIPVFIEEEAIVNLLNCDESFTKDFAGKRDRLVLELLFGTGIRRAELISINVPHIDFFNQTLRIFGKGNKERILPIYPYLIKLLKEYINERNEVVNSASSQLIVNDQGVNASGDFIYKIVTRYLGTISTQLKVSPHVLRHSFATSLLNRGASMNDIKELLGHESLAATQVYTSNSVEKLKSIYKQAHPKA